MSSAVETSILQELAQHLVRPVLTALHTFQEFSDQSNLGYEARLRELTLTTGKKIYSFFPTSAVLLSQEAPALAVKNSKVGSTSAITLGNLKLEPFKPYTPTQSSDKEHYAGQLAASVETCTAEGDPSQVEELTSALEGAEVCGHIVVAVDRPV